MRGPAARIFAQKPRAPVRVARMLISRTWFRILGRWLRRAMSCRVAGRGHRRSWSWPGTVPRTCCAGSSMSGTDRGTPGCPGSSPPGIRSGTATMWSVSAPVRCGRWRTRARTRGCRAGCLAATGESVRGPRPHPPHQALAIPGTSPRHDDRPFSGVPDTGGVPVGCGGTGRPLPEPGRRVEAICLQAGSACQPGELGGRVPFAGRAPRRELRWGDAEDGGQALSLLGGESPLPAVATPFGGTQGGVSGPAHPFGGLCLVPAVALAKDPDVRAGRSFGAGP